MSAFAHLLRRQLRHRRSAVEMTRRVLALVLLREMKLPVRIKVLARTQAA